MQLWAATHMLEVDEKKAITKLRNLQAAGKGLVSTSAKYTILEWNEGALSFRK